ncbi:MAG TPA: class I SAM-dependent methyltransferase [Polyangiaceae bacterium]|nr:class I SAM-dependent methyltransferase [Polyangiaceae bacterium]
MFPHFLARQLSRPSGLFGRLVMRVMNRGNGKMNAFAVRQLALDPSDRVLEVGFGGGVTLPFLMAGAARVTGVDRSADVVRRARAAFTAAIAVGHADFLEGQVEALPFDAASFEKVCTVNTVYFWRSLDAGCAEIHRVLAPGGRAVIGFLPKERMDRMGVPRDIFTSRATDEVTAALAKAGFETVRVERPEPHTPWNVVVAVR